MENRRVGSYGAWCVILLFAITTFGYYCEGCLKEERNALLAVKDDVNHPEENSLSDWVGEYCCNWSGIVCNNDTPSRVTEIHLNSIRAYESGTWHPNITLFAHFKELKTLDLPGNYIGRFAAPEGLCKLTNLRSLYLDSNELQDDHIPKCLGNLTKLEVLDLTNNSLKGYFGISTGFSQLHGLKELYLSRNKLSNISLLGFYKLHRLEVLNLGRNEFSSVSLSGLCELRNLRDLSLYSNNLRDDQLPSCLGSLTKLEGIAFANNSLTSYSLFSTGELSTLEELYLDQNKLKGIAPGICNLTNLRTLGLNINNVEDFSCLGELSMLEELYLNQNKLKGLSPGICNLTNLRILSINSNNLEDRNLLSCLGNLSMLENLDLSNNKLKGPLGFSPGICDLRKLRWLYFYHNAIEGRIHPCVGHMHSLEDLDLSYNEFHGSIGSLDNLTSIYRIVLSDNHLDGVVTISMFANLSHFRALELSNNPQLEVESEGTMWEPTFQLKTFAASNCKLNMRSGHGIPRFLSTQNQLEILLLSQNNLVGNTLPWFLHNTTTLVYLDLSENSFRGPFSTNLSSHFPNLEYLNMSHNGLNGRLPSIFGDQLETLDLSNNEFSGDIPIGLKSSTSLVDLRLSNNRLVGDILSRYYNMTKLAYLFLDGNDFTSTPSHGLSNGTSLLVLDVRKNSLSGTIPNWLLAMHSNLESLLLGKNNFVGQIPTNLCQIQNLHLLDLSHNNLSGSIPPCFNNITSWKEEVPVNHNYTIRYFSIQSKTEFTTKSNEYTYTGLPLSLMTGIDLSMNQLTGKLPLQLGSLKWLHSLNLSNNLFIGPIPESFKNMEQLESLDLSHNKLVGPIPQELTQLHSLSTFIVAFNNLSGQIPYFKDQFSTFEESSYIGNPGLCGKPLEKNCSFSNSSEPDNIEEEDDEDEESRIMDNPVIFYSFVAMSFALGFWGFIAFLIFKKTWRYKYFTTMDGYINMWGEWVSRILHCLKNCC